MRSFSESRMWECPDHTSSGYNVWLREDRNVILVDKSEVSGAKWNKFTRHSVEMHCAVGLSTWQVLTVTEAKKVKRICEVSAIVNRVITKRAAQGKLRE